MAFHSLRDRLFELTKQASSTAEGTGQVAFSQSSSPSRRFFLLVHDAVEAQERASLESVEGIDTVADRGEGSEAAVLAGRKRGPGALEVIADAFEELERCLSDGLKAVFTSQGDELFGLLAPLTSSRWTSSRSPVSPPKSPPQEVSSPSTSCRSPASRALSVLARLGNPREIFLVASETLEQIHLEAIKGGEDVGDGEEEAPSPTGGQGPSFVEDTAEDVMLRLSALADVFTEVLPRIKTKNHNGFLEPLSLSFHQVLSNPPLLTAAPASTAHHHVRLDAARYLVLSMCALVCAASQWWQNGVSQPSSQPRSLLPDAILHLLLWMPLSPLLSPFTRPSDPGIADELFKSSRPHWSFVRPDGRGKAMDGEDDVGATDWRRIRTEIWKEIGRVVFDLRVDILTLAFGRDLRRSLPVVGERGGEGDRLARGDGGSEGATTSSDHTPATLRLEAFACSVHLLHASTSANADIEAGKGVSADRRTSLEAFRSLASAVRGDVSCLSPSIGTLLAALNCGDRLLDEALWWLLWVLDGVDGGSGSKSPELDDTSSFMLVQALLDPLANSPDAAVRFIIFRVVSSLIGASTPEARRVMLVDLVECPYDNVCAAAVGLVRQEVGRALLCAPASPSRSPHPLASPALLRALWKPLFDARTMLSSSSNEGGPIELDEFLQVHQPKLVEAAGLGLFLLGRDEKNETAIRNRTTVEALRNDFIVPLRTQIAEWKSKSSEAKRRAEEGEREIDVDVESRAHAEEGMESTLALEILGLRLDLLEDMVRGIGSRSDAV